MDIYLPTKKELTISDKEKELTVICSDGVGVMHLIEIFDGVCVIYNNFKAFTCPTQTKQMKEFLEINHCLRGRFETVFNKDLYEYLGEGDLSINKTNIDRSVSEFPLGYYYGVEILIDIEKASKNKIFKEFDIDIKSLSKKLKECGDVFIIRSTKQTEDIIHEMYNIEESIKINYLKIKIMELLLFFNSTDFELVQNKIYYSKQQIAKVKRIKKEIIENLDAKPDMYMLADKYNINISFLRKCFKDIYGKPIYRWFKEYRLNYAAKLLKETTYPIIEIAAMVGYENPGKFSKAFFEFMKEKPLSYRKNQKL